MSEPRRLISPGDLEAAFLKASTTNTGKGIESCALLCGVIGATDVILTHVVFPKQSGTSNTVEMLEDTDLDIYLIEKGLSVVGWIHTHPTQTAFLSSIDLHTQYGYQRLLPEAVAVVCAPQYDSNKWLRLTRQGMTVIADCPFRGFHQHVSKCKLFGPALNVTFDSSTAEIVDFRGSRPGYSASSARLSTGHGEPDSPVPVEEPELPTTEDRRASPARGRDLTDAVTSVGEVVSVPAGEPEAVRPSPNTAAPKAAAPLPVSRLRRTAVKLEKNRSHREFLEASVARGYIPRGFRLKWTCHFEVTSEKIQGILSRASRELLTACLDLSSDKIKRLEDECKTLTEQIESGSSAEQITTVKAVVARDVARSKDKLRKVKGGKLRNLSIERTGQGAREADASKNMTPSPVEVVNHSRRQLSPTERAVLAKGLSFVPSRKQTVAQLTAELKEWERLMRLREYWHGSRSSVDVEGEADDDRRFKTSRWVPPKGRDPWLDLYLDEVTSSVIRETRTRGIGNMSEAEEDALLGLIRDEAIIIRPADKGSGIVVLDTVDYVTKLGDEMGDTSTYRSLASDKTAEVHRKVKKLVGGLHQKGYIGAHQKAYMVPAKPQPGQLQGNPKLHKPGAPLRTIVSGRGHATERVAELAEEQLRAHVESLPSYIRDTKDFLVKLRDTRQPVVGESGHAPLLFCMDVKKLYPSVPRAEGTAACRLALESRPDPSIPTERVLEMIDLVLDNNNFRLTTDQQFIQVDGTAIGSRLGRNYACTYMGEWEKRLLAGSEVEPAVYYRYIDDVFGIWLHGRDELVKFLERANKIHPKIQVEMRSSETEVEFLDVMVKLSGDGLLTTDLFEKPCDSKSYLHFESDHPEHTKRAVPYGLGLRLKRICSSDNDYRRHRDKLKDRLVSRNYPVSMVERELRKVDKLSREQVLNGVPVKRGRDRVPMALTFSRFLPNVSALLKKNRHLLNRSERMRNVFPADSMVAYKRGRNLKDLLVHRKTRTALASKGEGERRVESCGKGCVICGRMYDASERVVGPQPGCETTYDRTIGCKSVNVVYGIWCDVCKIVCYVGETGGCLYTRVQNHLSSIRAENPAVCLPVRNHFHSPHHSISDVRVVGLERVWSDNVEYRRARERRWMNLLGTQGAVNGLNKRYG